METSLIQAQERPSRTMHPRIEALTALIAIHRVNIGSALLAVSLVANLALPSFTSPLLLVAWASLALGAVFTGMSIANPRVFWSLCALLLFHALAIPGSLIWGNGNWELTAGVVLWMAPALLLYLANDPQRVFAWLVPAWLVHAGLIVWQGVTNWELVGNVTVQYGSPSGLSNNSNLGAGFLALGIVYLLTTPLKWLTAPLFVALLFTGSRWGLIVVAAVVLAMVLSRAISWRPLALAGSSVLVGVSVLGLFTPLGYAVAGIDSFAGVVRAVQVDVGVRLAVPHLPTFLPSGVAEHPGLHNVPLRIAVENGLLAAGLWVLITGWALWKQPRRNMLTHNGENTPSDPGKHDHPPRNVHRWLLLTLVLLSVLDYYTWMGHLGGFWWLLIGLLLKSNRQSTQVGPQSSQLPSKSVIR